MLIYPKFDYLDHNECWLIHSYSVIKQIKSFSPVKTLETIRFQPCTCCPVHTIQKNKDKIIAVNLGENKAGRTAGLGRFCPYVDWI